MALNWAALIRPQVTDDMQSRLEWFEERAAIMEFDAGMTRAEAEAAAAADGRARDACNERFLADP
jgi:hypothetical protein